MQTSTDRFLQKQDDCLHNGNIGLFTNQTSYHFASSKYLMEILSQRGVLSKVFIPEHGLFSELQDQEKLNETTQYQALCPNVEFISLYTDKEENLSPTDFSNLDAILIDIQDAGSRYFTYLSNIYYTLRKIHQSKSNVKVYIIDKVNPAGRQVEGSPLQKEFSSFIGITDIPHRHGLTIGELCNYFYAQLNASFSMEVIPMTEEEFHRSFLIQPSPNFPSSTTAQLYSGTCLFEATTLSEGRGTTRPFEIIGAPFISWQQTKDIINYIENTYPDILKSVHLRALKFIPTFHKHAGEVCTGFQIHILKKGFHALMLGVILLHSIQKYCDFSIFREGAYEYGSDKTGLELLLGDENLISSVSEGFDFQKTTAYLQEKEEAWIANVAQYLLYDSKLYSVKSY